MKISIAIIGERNSIISYNFLREVSKDNDIKVNYFVDASLPLSKMLYIYTGKKYGNINLTLYRIRQFIANKQEEYDCKALCQQLEIKWINSPEKNINKIKINKLQNIDYLYVLGCDQILKENLISWPKFMAINYHYSLLPAYKGKFSLFWQWYYDENVYGYTFHKIDTGIDTGEILYQRAIHKLSSNPLKKIRETVLNDSYKDIRRVINCIHEGEFRLEKTQKSPKEYYSVKDFHNRHIIEKNISKDELQRKVRKLKFLHLNESKLSEIEILNKDQIKCENENFPLIEINGIYLKVQKINDKPTKKR